MEESEESSKVHLSPKEKESELSHQTGTSSSIEIDSATEKKLVVQIIKYKCCINCLHDVYCRNKQGRDPMLKRNQICE